MRFGENAEKVIERVKAKITEIQPTLPKGLKLVNTYDRSDLIDRSIENLKHTLLEELIIVSLVILIFLWHFPSAVIPIITIPVTVLLAFIPMQMSGMTANIMSLGGICDRNRRDGRCRGRSRRADPQEVGALGSRRSKGRLQGRHRFGCKGSSRSELLRPAGHRGFFFPVFSLEAQEGRLFKPLAYTKTFAMIIAAVLAITLDPAMRLIFTHMKEYNFRPRWLARADQCRPGRQDSQ